MSSFLNSCLFLVFQISEARDISSQSPSGSPADWHWAFMFFIWIASMLERINRIIAGTRKHFHGKKIAYQCIFGWIPQLSSFLLMLHLVNQLSYSLMYARCTVCARCFPFFLFTLAHGWNICLEFLQNQKLAKISKMCGRRSWVMDKPSQRNEPEGSFFKWRQRFLASKSSAYEHTMRLNTLFSY